MDLAPGAVLQDKYLLVSSIGRGGMGEVFAAKRLDDGREVAIKVVSHRIVDDTLMARLEREAVAARRIRSAFVPEVYEVDKTPDGELYLVLRLLHGEALSARIKEQRVLQWREVESIVDDVLSGLADAHAAGVVHRDLKPGNIFLEHVEPPTLPGHTPAHAWIPDPHMGHRVNDERAMILDFGVCKLDASDGPKLTVTGESVGTVSYMAPEQIRGASDVDGRADLYSLAMVIFEMVCGRIAFDQSGQMAILAAKLEGRAKRLRDCAVVAVPPGLDALVGKALSRKPAERFASAREMQQAWRALGDPTEMPKAQLGQSTPSSAPTQTALTAATQTRVGGWPRVGLVLAGFCVLASMVAIALAMRVPKHAREEAVTPAYGSSAPEATSIMVVSTPPVDSAPVATIEIVDVARPDGGTVHRPPRTWRPPRPNRPTNVSSTATHFTTEPRY